MLCSPTPVAQWPADMLMLETPVAGVESHAVAPSREAPSPAETAGAAALVAPGAVIAVVLRGSPPEDQTLRDAIVFEPPQRVFSRRELCSTVASVAAENDLPVPFFANLIWQESGFQPHVVSPAGAQGIAQFMPDTASQYGLDNPFNPIDALAVSARFLKDLLGQFGNLGLAAAAYNAGPKRVQDWMAKKSKLPTETRNYVQTITGRPAESWAQPKAVHTERMPGRAPCVEVVRAVKAQQMKEEALQALAMKVPEREQSKAAFKLASVAATPAKPLKAASKTSARKLILIAAASRHKPRGPKVIVLKSAMPLKIMPATKIAAKRPAPGHHAGQKIKMANAR